MRSAKQLIEKLNEVVKKNPNAKITVFDTNGEACTLEVVLNYDNNVEFHCEYEIGDDCDYEIKEGDEIEDDCDYDIKDDDDK